MRIRFSKLQNHGRRVRGALRNVLRPAGDGGSATAEYAVVMLVACGFAAVLLGILRSGGIQGLLLKVIQSALKII